MPIYEYTCRECGNEFEELVFSSTALPPCPKCASENVEKLMSACSVQADSGSKTPSMPQMPPMGGCGGGG
ncbi:MAG: transcriptional regulator [Desulfovibrio sp.]|uniref:FmdB family zinc ribbon protein n=1 Tax=Pseudodesulfovibrio profundus TaxID=57320 RepID=UPI000BE25E42|nr:zinc ribbon domain-containing protein [Pseudodesulfovibrio profundus]MBC15818.1 transcriptional regulator [Desulfovibrio sp.]